MSDYRLQIIHTKSAEVLKSWEPGGQVETDLVEDLAGRVKDAEGVRKAFRALLHDLKSKVKPHR